MAEFDEKLNAILGNPEAMGQIMSMAKAITGNSGSEESPAADSSTAPVYEPVEALDGPTASPAAEESSSTSPDLSGLLGLMGALTGGDGGNSPLSALGDLDPALIQKGLMLFSEYSTTDDKKINLLAALKPFLKEERFANVDKAIQIAKLSRVIRVAFQLFKKEGSGDGAI